ncbi:MULTISPECIES: hypothetical protein [Streptomyces]|uniref:Uncharacterized protein n=1 Tax=Streptomyces cremeus TaxID=66881 RepID=A0ABV5P592_STRCM
MESTVSGQLSYQGSWERCSSVHLLPSRTPCDIGNVLAQPTARIDMTLFLFRVAVPWHVIDVLRYVYPGTRR